MERPPPGCAPEDQAARIRRILGILFNDLATLQHLQHLIHLDKPERLRLHLPPGVIGEAAVGQALAYALAVHGLSA